MYIVYRTSSTWLILILVHNLFRHLMFSSRRNCRQCRIVVLGPLTLPRWIGLSVLHFGFRARLEHRSVRPLISSPASVDQHLITS